MPEVRTISIISYNLHGCRDVTALCSVINNAAADVVALQDVAALPNGVSVAQIATATGYHHINEGKAGSLALLATRAITFIQTYDLGAGANCVKAELIVEDKRLILFNIRLQGGFFKRPEQIRSLLGPNLLESSDISLPTLLLGDFYDIIWVSGHYRFNDQLRRLAPPLFRLTYPAKIPLFSRDRVYAMGAIELIDMYIDYSKTARSATCHLPIVFTVKVVDSRIALLNLDKIVGKNLEVAPG